MPLLSDEITTGTLGFIKYGDREWLPAELDALMIIAALFAQLQARVAALDRLHYLAERDELTGLWNRRYLIDHLVDRMRTGRAGPVAVLYIDLDRLKGINDLHGHLAGDRFLAAFAERLRDLVDDTAAVARLGGDEFVVVLRDPVTVEGAQQLAERLHEQLRQRVTIGGERIGRTVSVAAALGIPGSHTASDLLGYADQALREAKNNGGDRVAVFSQDLGLRNDLRNDVELHLQGGIENNALVVHYLPEVNLRTHEVIAAEALVRWNHPNRGMLYPDSFIPIAESTGLAVELGPAGIAHRVHPSAAMAFHGAGNRPDAEGERVARRNSSPPGSRKTLRRSSRHPASMSARYASRSPRVCSSRTSRRYGPMWPRSSKLECRWPSTTSVPATVRSPD